MTAHVTAYDREKCIQASGNDFAGKPVDHRKMVEIIAGYVGTTAATWTCSDRSRRNRT